jgi:PAS domain-containing protein
VINLEQKTIKQQKQNQLILDIAGDGIPGIDFNGHHSFVNPAAAKLFGWNIEDLLEYKRNDWKK